MGSNTLPRGRWVLDKAQEGISSLRYEASATYEADKIAPDEVLVDIHAASLNYREIAICKVHIQNLKSCSRSPPPTPLGLTSVLTIHAKGNPSSAIPLPATPDVIPGSDGAGVVIAVGSAVSQRAPWLKAGAQVVAHMVPHIPDDELPSPQDIQLGLGQKLNGTLCRRGVFHHTTLVPMPRHMSFVEAATLTCSGLTAWNALMGLPGRQVKAGDWVLVQGTGGVSIAALQVS